MSIEEICKEFNIKGYTINGDNSIDVEGDIVLRSLKLTKFPLTFNKVSGSFNCVANELTLLEGCPKVVGGNFDCSNNKLTSLESGPESVGGFYSCSNNFLTTLKGCPESLYDYFDCYNNKITSLEFGPKLLSDYFYCNQNPIGSISSKMDKDFFKTFNSFKVLKDGVINLKRLRYLMSIFDKPILIEEIENNYTIK